MADGGHVRPSGHPYELVEEGIPQPSPSAESLLADEEVFRLLVEGVTDYAIFLLDAEGRIATWNLGGNLGAQRINGYCADEILSRHFSVFYPRDAVSRGWPKRELDRAIAEGRFEFEGWRLRKDGARFWANVVITAVHRTDGTLRGFSKVTHDLTERRRREEDLRQSRVRLDRRVEQRTAELSATNETLRREISERQLVEQALRDSERRQRELMELLPVGVYTCDAPSGEISYYNPRAAEHWGRRPPRGDSEVRFCGSLRLYAPDGSPLAPAESPMATVLRGGPPVRDQAVVIERPDASRINVRVSIEPIRGDNGELVGAVNVLQDVTEPERLLEEMRSSEEELRTLGRHLQEKVEALAVADQRKNEFLATLAHELRNPLAPLRYGLDLLERAEDDPETRRRSCAIMERQLSQMVRLVEDLLDVSRISTNKLRVRKETLELGPVLDSALETVRPLIDDAGHELVIELPAEPIWVHGDLTRLAQVFGNLLHNAAKFTPRGGRISLSAETRPGEVLVRVRDSGIGIAPHHLPHLFEMFSQAAPTLERSHDGLGIGLSLVRALVELHGGRVEAHSTGPGHGSEFMVLLPTSEPPDADATTAYSHRRSLDQEPRQRVLIADDNPDSVEALGALLELTGHEVAMAHDGREALQVAAAFRPDIALLDIGMPGLNGYETARRIRQEPWGRGMVLVAVTGWGQDDDKQRAREAGFDRHLTKPVDASDLASLLASASGRGEGR